MNVIAIIFLCLSAVFFIPVVVSLIDWIAWTTFDRKLTTVDWGDSDRFLSMMIFTVIAIGLCFAGCCFIH